MSQSEADKKYKAAMKKKGFVKKAYWVHETQVQELSDHAKKLRAEKERKADA